jgi:hypothetical protein
MTRLFGNFGPRSDRVEVWVLKSHVFLYQRAVMTRKSSETKNLANKQDEDRKT